MTAKLDLPIVSFVSCNGWGAWLDENHAASGGLWRKFAKKGSGEDDGKIIGLVGEPDVGICAFGLYESAWNVLATLAVALKHRRRR